MKLTKHIILRILLVVAPVMMALVPAKAQNTVYAGQTIPLSVTEVPGDVYTWELYDSVNNLNLAVIPGNCPVSSAFFAGGINTGPTVNVTWLLPGTYFFKVTSGRAGCTMNLKVGKMVVLEALPTALIDPVPPVCTGDSATLTIHFTGTAPWSIDLFDGTSNTTYNGIINNPLTIRVSPSATTTYTVTRVSDSNGLNLNPSNSVTLIIKPRPVTSPIIQYGP